MPPHRPEDAAIHEFMRACIQGKERNSPEGDGIVHQAVDELFKVLNEKAVSIGACPWPCTST